MGGSTFNSSQPRDSKRRSRRRIPLAGRRARNCRPQRIQRLILYSVPTQPLAPIMRWPTDWAIVRIFLARFLFSPPIPSQSRPVWRGLIIFDHNHFQRCTRSQRHRLRADRQSVNQRLAEENIITIRQRPVHTMGDRFNQGPLTAPWSWPAGCEALYVNPEHPASAWAAQGPCPTGEQSTCWPPRTVTGDDAKNFHAGFYSPGLVCPAGFTTACSTVSNKPGGNMPQSQSLLAGETAIGCCPT